MSTLLLRRIALIPLLLVGVTLSMQLLYLLLPGDPAATLAGGENASLSQVERIRAELKLDQPFYVAYWDWLTHAVRFDFGRSLVTDQGVAEELFRRLPATLSLGVVALVIAIAMGLIGGVFAAIRCGGFFDRLLLAVTSAGMAVPAFIIGIVLIVVFAVELGVAPAIGYVPISESPAEWARHIVMPAIAVAIAPAARIARTLRGSLIQALDSPYVLTAWSKGGRARVVILRHALRNSLIPTLTVLGLQVDLLIGGSLIVENVFSVPGVGAYVANAATGSDLPVIQGAVVLFALATILANLAVDIAYGIFNPKVRVSS
ncbi:ABC transporter permease [Saccharomonospora sp. NPDC046836]|uniref:ABC transporter permease n=1 Tax=Saccharomonospora sp. NPDC046836 TaxID=3156921 RepID=UPI0033C41190